MITETPAPAETHARQGRTARKHCYHRRATHAEPTTCQGPVTPAACRLHAPHGRRLAGPGGVGDRPWPRRRVLAVHRPAPRHVHRAGLAVRPEPPQALPRRQPRQSADHARRPLRGGPAGLVAAPRRHLRAVHGRVLVDGPVALRARSVARRHGPQHRRRARRRRLDVRRAGAPLSRSRLHAAHGGRGGSLSRHVADGLGIRARQAARRSRLSRGAGVGLAARVGRAGRRRVRAGAAARAPRASDRGRPRRAVATGRVAGAAGRTATARHRTASPRRRSGSLRAGRRCRDPDRRRARGAAARGHRPGGHLRRAAPGRPHVATSAGRPHRRRHAAGRDPAGARGRRRRRLALPPGAARQPHHGAVPRPLAADVRLPHGGRVAGRAVRSRLRRVGGADGRGHAVRQRPARRPRDVHGAHARQSTTAS